MSEMYFNTPEDGVDKDKQEKPPLSLVGEIALGDEVTVVTPEDQDAQPVWDTPTAVPRSRRRTRNTREDAGSNEDPVHWYLKNIGRHQLLTRQQEIDLATQMRSMRNAKEELEAFKVIDGLSRLIVGKELELPRPTWEYRRAIKQGEDAEKTFIESNLRLVVSIAKKYGWSNLPLLDLIQEGNFGLMHAVEKFDERKGFKFSTYATWWIRQAITRAIANIGTEIRIPVHSNDAINDLVRAERDLDEEPKTREDAERLSIRSEYLKELAARMGVTEARLQDIIGFRNLGNMLHLDAPMGEDETAFGEVVPETRFDDEYGLVDNELMFEVLRRAVMELPDQRTREIMTMRFGLDGQGVRSLEDVGQHFGITRERTRQIQAKATNALRQNRTLRAMFEALDG